MLETTINEWEHELQVPGDEVDVQFFPNAKEKGIACEAIQVTHFKRWTLGSILRTDIWDRGVPWTQLILAHSGMNNDLTLKRTQRVSVLLTNRSTGRSRPTDSSALP